MAWQNSLAPRFGALLKKTKQKKNINELYKYGLVMQLDQAVEECVRKPVDFLVVGTTPRKYNQSRH